MVISFQKEDIKAGGQHIAVATEMLIQGFERMNTEDCVCFIAPNSYLSFVNIENLISQNVHVKGCPVFILADISILQDAVYSYLPNSFNLDEDDNITPKTFGEYDAVIATSLDESKVILRTNIDGYDLDSTVIIKLLDEPNIEILGTLEVIEVKNSIEFQLPENQ